MQKALMVSGLKPTKPLFSFTAHKLQNTHSIFTANGDWRFAMHLFCPAKCGSGSNIQAGINLMDSKHEIDKLKMTYTITTRNDNTNRNIFNRVGEDSFLEESAWSCWGRNDISTY